MQIHRKYAIACSPKTLWRCLTEFHLKKQWQTQLIDEMPDDPSHTGLNSTWLTRYLYGSKILCYHYTIIGVENQKQLSVRFDEKPDSSRMQTNEDFILTSGNDRETTLDFTMTITMKSVLYQIFSSFILLSVIIQLHYTFATLKKVAERLEKQNNLSSP